MYVDLERELPLSMRRGAEDAAVDWTVIVPFFNERELLADTIASLARQIVPFRLILVDNGSTDGSAAVAEAAARRHRLDYMLVTERTPGKVSALRAGFGWSRTRWTATCDADTLYPPHYLATAGELLSRRNCVTAGAYFVDPGANADDRAARAGTIRLAARLLPRQSHAGGAGQAFCTATLRAVGGFDPDRWNFVLEDHEVIHRMMPRGRMLYSEAFWCMPSPRERDRHSIRWNLFERLTYSVTAPWAGDWFFYSFLSRRLRRRRLLSQCIRERQFQQIEETELVPTHSVR
ncbi:glycosyltransferase family 2 protein [Sphingomonas sp. NPDC092331]|jgi:glycosyltransferase involved in cell wall biosynthesis|uniref:glycosyltransferase family 2 protein n=1 Tax=unclassified Sphingomonas TaxID=196159 RepID=UPI0031F5B6A0